MRGHTFRSGSYSGIFESFIFFRALILSIPLFRLSFKLSFFFFLGIASAESKVSSITYFCSSGAAIFLDRLMGGSTIFAGSVFLGGLYSFLSFEAVEAYFDFSELSL